MVSSRAILRRMEVLTWAAVGAGGYLAYWLLASLIVGFRRGHAQGKEGGAAKPKPANGASMVQALGATSQERGAYLLQDAQKELDKALVDYDSAGKERFAAMAHDLATFAAAAEVLKRPTPETEKALKELEGLDDPSAIREWAKVNRIERYEMEYAKELYAFVVGLKKRETPA